MRVDDFTHFFNISHYSLMNPICRLTIIAADSNAHGSDEHHCRISEKPQHSERITQVFSGYSDHDYPSRHLTGGIASHPPQKVDVITAKGPGRRPEGLFPDLPETRKRKFILVEDTRRGSRLRVRVTLDGVDTNEIPDSFRTRASVFPRSFFPREMQNPPPNSLGAHFFSDDASDDGIQNTDGRESGKRGVKMTASMLANVPFSDNQNGNIVVPKLRRAQREKELKLNDLGHRMAWLQSRVFSGRNLFLQRACKLHTRTKHYRRDGT